MGYALEAKLELAEKYCMLSLGELKRLATLSVQELRKELEQKQAEISQQEAAIAVLDQQFQATWAEIVANHNLHPGLNADQYRVEPDPGTKLSLVNPSKGIGLEEPPAEESRDGEQKE